MKYLNDFGLLFLMLALTITPFHFYSEDFGMLSLYREMMAAIFLLLLFANLFAAGEIPITPRKEVFYLMLFPILLMISVLYDPMQVLYKEQSFLGRGGVSNITNFDLDPRLYILRNAFLYLPMTFYIASRGLNQKEIQQIAFISVLIAPFSALAYTLHILESGDFSIFLLGELAEGGRGLVAYNSYVPYLTFPVISGLYLLSAKTNLVKRMVILGSLSIVTVFIFISSSRQSLLFIIIAISAFLFFGNTKVSLKRAFYFSLATLVIYFSYNYIMADFTLDEALVEKYQYGENTRFSVMYDGIIRMEPYQYLTGAGLSSVIGSGPHNDYIRWTQRVGIFFMIIAFIPYFMVGFKLLGKLFRDKNDLLSLYFGFAVSFVIYHSIFGYPREDAFQAIWCYLGISLWLGYDTFLNKKIP